MIKKIFIPVLFLLMIILMLTGCGSKPYDVSGKITDLSDQGVGGVTITFSGGTSGTALTNQDGRWTMVGLKGTVTITPNKEGWAFSPRERVVSKEITNVNFLGSDQPESLLNDMLERFCEARNAEDIDSLIQFFDDTFFVNNELTREEFRSYLESKFEGEDITFSMENKDLDFDVDLISGEGIINLTSMIKGNESWDYVWEISVIREGFDWLITNYDEMIYELYVEKPGIEVMLNEFIQAFVDEDIQNIASLTSDQYEFNNMDKAAFIEYMTELFTRINVHSYESDIEDISFFGDDYSAWVKVYALMSADGDEATERVLLFSMELEKILDDWYIKSLALTAEGNTKLGEWEIDEPDGETDYLEIIIDVDGTYSFRTGEYLEECDTELLLFNANKLQIDHNQDLDTNKYAMITREMTTGTYYVKVKEAMRKHLYCVLEYFREGL